MDGLEFLDVLPHYHLQLIVNDIDEGDEQCVLHIGRCAWYGCCGQSGDKVLSFDLWVLPACGAFFRGLYFGCGAYLVWLRLGGVTIKCCLSKILSVKGFYIPMEPSESEKSREL